ncbi:Vacuolar cation/proton exchanger 1a [Platanthera guangdongensis]|uniref:Vacuolar cation/proton exchanger 1a n=1 Tax=Platanthera guangdongensis TaxID=2320717 RepID=A0ABR2N5X4_9ASPA
MALFETLESTMVTTAGNCRRKLQETLIEANFILHWTHWYAILAFWAYIFTTSCLHIYDFIITFDVSTVSGLLNATCGNAPELIIAIFALQKGCIDLVKFSLVGSILSNLLLVLGTSLFCGGVVNLGQEQLYNRKQTDANMSLLLMSALSHVLLLMFRYVVNYGEHDVLTFPTLTLSRVGSLVMLTAYIAFIFFQLKTHREFFESREVNGHYDNVEFGDEAVIGIASAFAWLMGATLVIAVLSEYIVGTIEILRTGPEIEPVSSKVQVRTKWYSGPFLSELENGLGSNRTISKFHHLNFLALARPVTLKPARFPAHRSARPVLRFPGGPRMEGVSYLNQTGCVSGPQFYGSDRPVGPAGPIRFSKA